MKNKITFTLFLLLILSSCNKTKYFSGSNSITEDFENIDSISDLFKNDKWSYYQQTENGSYITVDTTIKHSGQQAMKFFASKGTISKSDLANNKMSFWKDETVEISAWYYLADSNQLDYVFLFDIEERTSIGANPGIRMAIDENGYLIFERNKYGESTIHQTNKVKFPKNEWVEIKIEISLSQNNDGYIKLWQNSVLLIDKVNIQTLPKDKLYIIQGTKGMYQSLQFGITATTSVTDLTLYMDDIEVKVK